MGLFESKKKEEKVAKITDFFSAEDLSKIKGLIEPRKAERKYQQKYIDIVDCLLAAVSNPEKSLDKKEVTKILFSVGAMTKIEPSLNSILTPAIDKMRAFRK